MYLTRCRYYVATFYHSLLASNLGRSNSSGSSITATGPLFTLGTLASSHIPSRQTRLTASRDRAKQRLLEESLEEKEVRLHDMRQCAQERLLNESMEEKEERLDDMRQRTQDRLLNESMEEKEERLDDMRQRAQDRLLNESMEEKEDRLDDMRQRAQVTSARRRKHHQEQQQTIMTAKQVYLHAAGWAQSHDQLHEQPWAQQEMQSFHDKQKHWQQRLCTICHELWPTHTCLSVSPKTYICTRCKRDKIL